MKPSDFCSWLKGHYDMGGSGQPLSAFQADMVSRHLDLVFQAGPASVGQGPQAQFCRWLAGALEAQADIAPGAGVPTRLSSDIESKVASALKLAQAAEAVAGAHAGTGSGSDRPEPASSRRPGLEAMC